METVDGDGLDAGGENSDEYEEDEAQGQAVAKCFATAGVAGGVANVVRRFVILSIGSWVRYIMRSAAMADALTPARSS